MLNSLDLLRIPGFKVVHPKLKAVKLDGIVDVFERGYKRDEEHQALEFIHCLEIFLFATLASREFKEESHEVNDEWIPHQKEGHSRPQVMAIVVQFVGGE